ncbi:MAG TPA: hypothetical protein VJ225_07780 [Nitrososphaeraceae archaeon]|nr:hypothetical protein [Nitrososphaeraceae archaeon]
MKRKEETLIAIVGMAIFATVIATSSSTQALASVDDTTNNGVASDGIDTAGTTDNTNEDENGEDKTTESANSNGEEASGDGDVDDIDSTREANDDFQACLSENGVEESLTVQEVQDCMDPSYEGTDDNDSQPENTGNGDEDENDDNGDSEEEEDEWE